MLLSHIQVLNRNTSSAAVALWGCYAMHLLAEAGAGASASAGVAVSEGAWAEAGQGRAVGGGNEDLQMRLVAAGACEAVATTLFKFTEV